jgi:hypothetical protein
VVSGSENAERGLAIMADIHVLEADFSARLFIILAIVPKSSTTSILERLKFMKASNVDRQIQIARAELVGQIWPPHPRLFRTPASRNSL